MPGRSPRPFAGGQRPFAGNARRILIAGPSGAGKSTIAAEIATRMDLPYTEIDSLYHGPEWVPREEFMTDVATLIAGESWVVEWQYGQVRDALASRATGMIWLDFSWPVQMSRLVRRTLRRRFREEELWNGNFEGPLREIFTDPEHIIGWGWRRRHSYRALDEYLAREHPHVLLIRLRTPREARRWLDSLTVWR